MQIISDTIKFPVIFKSLNSISLANESEVVTVRANNISIIRKSENWISYETNLLGLYENSLQYREQSDFLQFTKELDKHILKHIHTNQKLKKHIYANDDKLQLH